MAFTRTLLVIQSAKQQVAIPYTSIRTCCILERIPNDSSVQVSKGAVNADLLYVVVRVDTQQPVMVGKAKAHVVVL